MVQSEFINENSQNTKLLTLDERNLYNFAKRFIDIVVSIFFIILFSPLMLLIIIAIKIESPSGGIFADSPMRLGKDHKTFKMLKFRSMIPEAHKKIVSDPQYSDLKKIWKQNQGKLKLNDDPRVTKVGRFIRKFDLDELPQFFNVLVGNMSIVGPRAYFKKEYSEFIETYPQLRKKFKHIFTVKPGITGIWQVSGRNNLTIQERILLDFDYSNNKSIIKDVKIMLKTPLVVISRKGAVD